MKSLKTLLVLISISFLFIRCQNEADKTSHPSISVQAPHYISIDGLWRSTPETATKYPNGTLEYIFHITGNAYGRSEVKGCFLWDDRFYNFWELENIQFDNSTGKLKITDKDGNYYTGIVDSAREKIIGMVHSGNTKNTGPANTLNFIRAENITVDKLFFPRPPDSDGSVTYFYKPPEQVNDGLLSASIFEFINDTSAIYNLMERIIKQEFGRLESLLIIKDNKLVLEEYFYGYDRTQIHHIHSCTKSVTSLLIGMMLDRYNNKSVDSPVFDFLPEYESLKTKENAQITLKHVLTMTAGFSEEEGNAGDDDPEDIIGYILGLPLDSKPGEKFRYSNNCADLLGGVIYSITGKKADIFAKENLFAPLGISEYYWQYENGMPHCHSDLYLLPRDMAKIGLLALNNGSWNGRQIVPKEWIEESTHKHVAESEFFDYGYQWWYRSKQNTPWWDNPVHGGKTEHDMFLALGYGGQYIMVSRDLNLIVVTTSSDYGDGGTARKKVPMVIEEIAPIFENE